MSGPIKVTIKDGVGNKLALLGKKAIQAMKPAGQEAANEVLDTEGLRRYPPATEANQPPTPYYIRGVGMQYNGGNDGSSERYGSRWKVASEPTKTTITNAASYSGYLGGEQQAGHMAAKGWRKITDVIKEKMPKIVRIYEKWIVKTIRELGL